MAELFKRRGRPPTVKTQILDTKQVDEVVAENPTAPTVVADALTFTAPTTDIQSDSAWDAEQLGQTSDGAVTEELLSKHEESPVEEKIHELVQLAQEVEGWHNDIHSAPTDGRRLMVSKTGIDQGVLVFWRISKVVDRARLRYVPKGRWTDFLTKKDIEFTPVYWKPYNPEEYWPLTV